MTYRILLFVHVMGAILWFGGGVVYQLFTESIVKSDDMRRAKNFIEIGSTLGKTYFGPLTGIVLVAGIALVLNGDWGFDHVFVIGGLVGLVASASIGAVAVGGTVEKLQQGFAAPTVDEPSQRALLLRLRTAGRIDAAIMTVVVFLMTVKPGG
jgi:hypothetical protein